MRGGGPEVNPVTRHVKCPRQEGPNIRPGEAEVKEPTRTERPPSAPQKQGVIATASEEDRATATLCLSQDATGSGCRDHMSAQSTESWKCEEGDPKSTQSLGTANVQRIQPNGTV